MGKILAIPFIIFSLTANAEYRVFTLLVSNLKNQEARQIETTLDPEQYATIYPLNKDEYISYVDTWMCKGRTDKLRAHCDKPVNLTQKQPDKNPAPDRSPASIPSQSPDIKK
jgi:hypothetical protein